MYAAGYTLVSTAAGSRGAKIYNNSGLIQPSVATLNRVKEEHEWLLKYFDVFKNVAMIPFSTFTNCHWKSRSQPNNDSYDILMLYYGYFGMVR